MIMRGAGPWGSNNLYAETARESGRGEACRSGAV